MHNKTRKNGYGSTKIAGDNIESMKQAVRAEIEKSRCLITSPRHKQKPYHRLRIREEGGKKREASGRKQKTLRQPRIYAR